METMEKVKEYMKGTTTVGLACKDGVILASDKRATMGTLIAHKIVQKSFKIDKHLGATVAGSVGDAQSLIRWMQAESKLYRMRKGEEMSVKAASTLTGNILFSQRHFPMIVQLIIGGMDKEGASLYSIDPLGSSIQDNFIATGSGSPMALGVLEDNYKEGLSLKEGIPLSIRALRSALERDAMTGDGIDVVKITEEGFKKLTENEIKEITKTI
jgi:proteasome beta subunit